MVLIRRDESNGGKYVKAARAGLIVCAALLISPASSGAQQVAAKNNRNPSKNNQTSNSLSPSQLKPVVIVVEPSAQEVDAIAQQEAANRSVMGYPPDDWVAVFTGVLGVSTILLWLSTHKSARAAARAAVIAERALLDLEGPYIFVSSIELAARAMGPGGGFLVPHVALALKNYGRTPAIINSLEIGLAIYQLKAPKDIILDRSIFRDISLVLGANDTCNTIRSHIGDVTDLAFSQIVMGDAGARIKVAFFYRDIFDETPKNEAFWFNYDSELQLFLLETGVVPTRRKIRR